MANPKPNMSGLRGTTPVGYERSQVVAWLHTRIKNTVYVAPTELPDNPAFMRKPEVCELTGLSYFTISNLEKKGQFPPRYRLLRDEGYLASRRGRLSRWWSWTASCSRATRRIHGVRWPGSPRRSLCTMRMANGSSMLQP